MMRLVVTVGALSLVASHIDRGQKSGRLSCATDFSHEGKLLQADDYFCPTQLITPPLYSDFELSIHLNIFVISPVEGEERLIDLQEHLDVANNCFSGSAGTAIQVDTGIRFTGELELIQVGDVVNGVEITEEMMAYLPPAETLKTLVTQVGRNHNEAINVFITDASPSVTHLPQHGYPSNEEAVILNYAEEVVPDEKTLCHEIGHHLGLYHIFQGSCHNTTGATNGPFESNGDCVKDTSPEQLPGFFPSCITPPFQLCGSVIDDLEPYFGGVPYTNIMDYFNDCRAEFTVGQTYRMQETIRCYRQSFCDADENSNCLGACNSDI